MKNTAETTENIAELHNRIAELEALVKYYEEQFRLSKHRQFGASSEKSEYDFAQLSIFNEAELFADEAAAEPEFVEVEKHYRKRTRLTTDKLPENLPIEVVKYELSESKQICSECGSDLHVMGCDTRRELVIIPAQVKIREHIRNTYSCRHCEKTGFSVPVKKAPVNAPVIKGSFASPEAIAHIMTQKFVMSVPLYRQEQEWKRQGILLSRQTMSNWLVNVAEDWLKPIYDALYENLCAYDVLHADETTLQVLREPGKNAQSKSYMWLYRTSGDAERPIVLYEYQPDRKAVRPKEFLKDFTIYFCGFVTACTQKSEAKDGYKLFLNVAFVGIHAYLLRPFVKTTERIFIYELMDGIHIRQFIPQAYLNQGLTVYYILLAIFIILSIIGFLKLNQKQCQKYIQKQCQKYIKV